MKADGKKRNHVRLVQNTAILLLSVSAVFLLLQVISFSTGQDGNIASLFPDTALSDDAQAHSTDLTGMPSPVSLVVNWDYGRSGHLLTSPEDTGAQAATALLQEALGSAAGPKTAGEDAFRQALSRPGIYFDCTNALPVSIFAAQYGVAFDPQVEARYFLIAVEEDQTVGLYFWSGEGNIFRYSTAVTGTAVTDVVTTFQTNGALFAFEAGETMEHLDPYTILTGVRNPRTLTSAIPAALDMDSLLERLDFNPHTNSRYPQSNGTEVVVESPRTLRVQTDGTVIYTGDTEAASDLYRVASAGGTPTEAEAVLAVRQLLEELLSDEDLADAVLYCSGVEKSKDGMMVYFDYMVDGIPIYFADGAAAMEAEITGDTLTAFQLKCRQYTLRESTYTLLPLPLAAAVSQYEGGCLTIGYVDRGNEEVLPSWMAN